ncbi:MAG: hypothetical protein H7Z37_10740, partial [Pyrinomonadaceae bacterium]|nr:hypothetical protein [Pyrinomonadaceae bacterium]
MIVEGEIFNIKIGFCSLFMRSIIIAIFCIAAFTFGTKTASAQCSCINDLFSIYFTDVNTGFAVGANGTILKTTNSGSSLKPLRQSYYDLCNGKGSLVTPNFIGGTKPLSYAWEHSPTTPSVFVAPQDNTV